MCCESVYSDTYNTTCFAGLKIFIPLRLGNTFFWDETLHRWPSGSRPFEGKYYLHLQSLAGPRRILPQTLNALIWRRRFLSKHQDLLNRWHSVISQKNESYVVFWWFLGPSAKLPKSGYWLCHVRPSVCLSARMEQLGYHYSDFHEIGYLSIFRKYLLTYSMEQSPSWEANRVCS